MYSNRKLEIFTEANVRKLLEVLGVDCAARGMLKNDSSLSWSAPLQSWLFKIVVRKAEGEESVVESERHFTRIQSNLLLSKWIS